MDLAELEQRLIAIETDLLAHPAVLGQLPRPNVTWMKVLSAVVMAISIFLLIAGTLATPYAAAFIGLAALLAPLERLLDIYLTNTTAKAAATRAVAAAQLVGVRHQASLRSTLPPAPPAVRPVRTLAELPPMPPAYQP